jgi:hypothetical protein
MCRHDLRGGAFHGIQGVEGVRDTTSRVDQAERHWPEQRARRLAGEEPGGGCSYVQKWSLLGDLGGYVQVFISRKHYDRVAKGFLKRTKDPCLRTN